MDVTVRDQGARRAPRGEALAARSEPNTSYPCFKHAMDLLCLIYLTHRLNQSLIQFRFVFITQLKPGKSW